MTHRHCAKKASRRSRARRCGRPMWMRGRVMMRNPADRFSKLVCAFFLYDLECTGRMRHVQQFEPALYFVSPPTSKNLAPIYLAGNPSRISGLADSDCATTDILKELLLRSSICCG